MSWPVWVECGCFISASRVDSCKKLRFGLIKADCRAFRSSALAARRSTSNTKQLCFWLRFSVI